MNYVKYASSKVYTERLFDEHFMDEMGTWSRLLVDAARPWNSPVETWIKKKKHGEEKKKVWGKWMCRRQNGKK